MSDVKKINPKEGKVLQVVKGNQVIINLGSDDGLEEHSHSKLLVYRMGDEFQDPDTGDTIGPAELVQSFGMLLHVQRRLSTWNLVDLHGYPRYDPVEAIKPLMGVMEDMMKKLGTSFCRTCGQKFEREETLPSDPKPPPVASNDGVRAGDLCRVMTIPERPAYAVIPGPV